MFLVVLSSDDDDEEEEDEEEEEEDGDGVLSGGLRMCERKALVSFMWEMGRAVRYSMWTPSELPELSKLSDPCDLCDPLAPCAPSAPSAPSAEASTVRCKNPATPWCVYEYSPA